MKWLLVGAFAAAILACGFLSLRKTQNVNDFFLGGRGIGPWMSAFAYGTTYFSAVLFVGYAGKVGWGFGLSAVWVAIGNALVGSLLAWKVLAKRTREMTERLQAITMPEFLKARYDSHGLKIFASLVIFIFLVPYSASVFMGLSYVFEEIFGIPYNYVLFFMAGLTAIFLLMGGYLAVALTDFIQGIVMIFGIGVMVYYVTSHPNVGGIIEGIQRTKAIDPELTQVVGPGGWLPLVSLVILTSLGSWGLPQMVQKFYAIKDAKAINAAMIITTVFALVISVSIYFIGSLSHLFFTELPLDPVTGAPNVDLVMPKIIATTMPELAAVLILLLVLSASISTLSSLVLVSSSSLGIDLIKSYFLPNLSKQKSMMLVRVLCLLFIGLSLLIALTKPTIILTLMAVSWGTVAGVFLAPYLYGLYWKKTTKAGAWAGALTGLSFSLGASIYFNFDAKLIPTIGSLAMLIPLAVVPAVSLVTARFSQNHIKLVFGEETEETVLKNAQAKEDLVIGDLG